MPESKVINHNVLAHEWLYDLMPCPNMRIKVGVYTPRYPKIGQDCGNAKHGIIRMASFDLNIIIIVYFENSKCQMYHLQVTNVTFAILKALFVDFPKLICYDDCKYEKSGGICL